MMQAVDLGQGVDVVINLAAGWLWWLVIGVFVGLLVGIEVARWVRLRPRYPRFRGLALDRIAEELGLVRFPEENDAALRARLTAWLRLTPGGPVVGLPGAAVSSADHAIGRRPAHVASDPGTRTRGSG